MKREQRQPYLDLCGELKGQRPQKWVGENIDIDICSLCRFAGADESEVYCAHPLNDKCDLDRPYSRDCWAFRPSGTADELRQDWLTRFADIQAETEDDAEWERQHAQEAN